MTADQSILIYVFPKIMIIFIKAFFCVRASVCAFHFIVITRLNSDPLLMALVHPLVEKSQF